MLVRGLEILVSRCIFFWARHVFAVHLGNCARNTFRLSSASQEFCPLQRGHFQFDVRVIVWQDAGIGFVPSVANYISPVDADAYGVACLDGGTEHRLGSSEIRAAPRDGSHVILARQFVKCSTHDYILMLISEI